MALSACATAMAGHLHPMASTAVVGGSPCGRPMARSSNVDLGVSMPSFEGHENRECGEHRTTGKRAWCFECSEWCYDTVPCKGCELPMLRKVLKEIRDYCTSVVTGYSEINSEYDSGYASGRDSLADSVLDMLPKEEQ